MSSHSRKHTAVIISLLFSVVLFSGSTLKAQKEVQVHNQERYERVPVIGPTTEGGVPIALDPPSDDEVLQALEKSLATRGGIPLLFEKHRNNLKIAKEKIADYVDPPRDVPLIGKAQLHHAHYKCTIYISERTINGWPAPPTLEEKAASKVIYIDHNHFHKCGDGPTPASKAPHSSQTSNFSPGFGRGESLDSLKQRYNELEQQTHQLANKLKQSKSPIEAERKELQLAVRKSFDARQAMQRAELADLAQRMQSMEQSIDMRDKLADEVVQRRIEDLLNPSLKWDVTQTKTPNLSQATERPEPDASRQPIARAIWEIVNQLSLGDDQKTPFGIVLTEIESYPKEQLADFKEEIQEQIVSELKTYGHLIVTSRRVAEATLSSLQLKTKDLLLPKQQAQYFEALEREGQPAQSILFTKLIRNDSTSYFLVLELIDRSGRGYKSSANVSKTNPENSIPQATYSFAQSIPPAPTSAPYDPGNRPETIIMERIQGKWIAESMLSAGKDSLSDYSEPFGVWITGNEMRFKVGEQDLNGPIPMLLTGPQGSHRSLESADQPLPMDFVLDPNGEQVAMHGIIASDGLTLSICFADGDVSKKNGFRPTSFVPGTKVTVIKCHRAPKSNPDEVDLSTSPPTIGQPTRIITRRYSVGSFVTKSFFNRGGLIYDKPLYDQYESQIEQSLQELEKTLAAVCTQPPRFVSIERDSRSLLIGHTAEGHDEIASFMRDIGVNNDRIRLRGDVLIIKSDQAKTLGIDLSQHVLTPNELEKLHEFAISDSSKQNKQELSKTNHFIVDPRPLDETLESGVRIAMRHSGLIPLTIAAIVSDGKQIQLRFDTHVTEDVKGRSVEVVLSLFQVLGDGESVLLPILEDKFYVLLTADIVRELKSSVNEKEEAAKARHSSSLPAKHDANVDHAVFDWSDLLKLLPESGTVLWMFSHEPDKREQMLPIAEKVAEEASVKLIHLPIDNWRTLFSKEATHFVLMKDRQLIGTKTGLVTEVKLKEFVAQAKDWLTPQSTGVMESSLVRVDCYISAGNDNIGSQHGPAIPITLAVVAIDGDEALLFGTEGIAKYQDKGYACVAIVRDDKADEKQVPLEVVLAGNVPLKKPDALNDDNAPVITIPFFKYDKENKELQEAYDVGSAIYRIRGAHGLTTVKLAPFDDTPQKGERVLAGEFNSSRHHGPIHRFQSPFHWQTQQNLSESDWPIYGANHHGAKMFQVLCPTIPAPSSFLFNAHGRLIGTHGLGNLTEKDKTYTALMPYAIHSVLQAGLETIDHAGLKTALTQTLEESASAPSEPKYSSHPISWWLDSYWDNATASSKTDENTIQEYVASEAIRKLREKPECKAAIEAALAKWFASVEHEVNEIRLVRAAKCFVTAAGPEYQELAVDYLCKIWSQLPTLSLEKQIERLGEETELNDLLKQLVLNDELANKFAERLTNGTSGDRSLVTYYLFSSTVLKDEKDPKVAELNTWLHNHRELLFPAFTAALKDESEQVRLFSLASLVGLDQKLNSLPSTLTSVVESDASPRVRGLAIGMFSTKEMLSQVKSQNIEIAPLMIKTLEHDSSIDVRYAALEVLIAMDTESEFVHKNLMEWAKSDECEKVKYSLDLTLRNYQAGNRPQSIDELIELLSDPQWGSTIEVKEHNWSTYHRWARQYAIAILKRYAAHAHRALPTLEAELARNNKDTLSFATEAIDSVRGYCPGFPIEKLQGQWEFVSIQKPEGSTSFFDLQAAADQQPASVIRVSGTQLKLGDRVLGEISHHRGSDTRSFVMLLDPDGKKRHCNGCIDFDSEYEINRAPEPEWLKLQVYELLDNWDATQTTKQTYEFRPVTIAQ